MEYASFFSIVITIACSWEKRRPLFHTLLTDRKHLFYIEITTACNFKKRRPLSRTQRTNRVHVVRLNGRLVNEPLGDRLGIATAAAL